MELEFFSPSDGVKGTYSVGLIIQRVRVVSFLCPTQHVPPPTPHLRPRPDPALEKDETQESSDTNWINLGLVGNTSATCELGN
jgi:hypothetical protein